MAGRSEREKKRESEREREERERRERMGAKSLSGFTLGRTSDIPETRKKYQI